MKPATALRRPLLRTPSAKHPSRHSLIPITRPAQPTSSTSPRPRQTAGKRRLIAVTSTGSSLIAIGRASSAAYLHGHGRGRETKRFAAPLWLFQASWPQAQNSRLEEDAKLVVLPLELVCYEIGRAH